MTEKAFKQCRLQGEIEVDSAADSLMALDEVEPPCWFGRATGQSADRLELPRFVQVASYPLPSIPEPEIVGQG
jgi:hypothetical protein